MDTSVAISLGRRFNCIAPSLGSSPRGKTRALRLRGLTFALRERCPGLVRDEGMFDLPPADSNKGMER